MKKAGISNRNNVTALTAVLSLGLALGTSTWAFHTITAFLSVAEPTHLSPITPKRIASDDTAYPLFRNMRGVAREAAGLIMLSYADATELTAHANVQGQHAGATQ